MTPASNSLRKRGLLPLPVSETRSFTKIRLRVIIPRIYHQEPVISHLISNFGLQVNITAARLDAVTTYQGLFEMELRGTPEQIQNGLSYLEKLQLTIQGRPNTDGDGWHC